MKKNTILLFLLFAVTNTFAQVKTQYFDEDWNPVAKEDMVYYRPEPKAVNGKYLFKDYYKSGKLQFEGLSLSKTEEKFDGEVKYFGENGKISGTSIFKNGVLNGSAKTYFEDGRLRQDALMNDGEEQTATVYTYKGTEIEGSPTLYDLITVFEKEERVKQIIYDGNLKGIRQENYFHEGKAKYFGPDGKLLGEIIFDLYGNPNNGTMVEYDFNPMKVSHKRFFADGKEQVMEQI
ncbi:antitoxin component YwqK of YwqJK toxin-antitoxin module [Pedobacter cryoconitis]|uniref:hypothetical protein n=1 Tax=Pedobacter cryoconitis TaxID=188932 RepID=UPI0016082CC4|nr:hypothetical protein [Pedobacter cryoconitis]MBB6271690.1 antitoxin component YwqK of YwqJK toxin-antitoxin module [Pedobacter cryoconitis]